MAWFPQGELEKALERWPGFIERWDINDHADYCRRVDDELRVMTSQGIAPLEVAPINVDEFVAWCADEGWTKPSTAGIGGRMRLQLSCGVSSRTAMSGWIQLRQVCGDERGAEVGGRVD